MKSIGDKIVYPAYNKYGYVEHANPDAIQGITYKEALVLQLLGGSHLSAAGVVNKANDIIEILDEEREQNGTTTE